MSVLEKSSLHNSATDSKTTDEAKQSDPDTNSYTVKDEFGTTHFVRGEPVITTGADVSNFAVDVRDDGDEALTFRSFVIGTVVAGLGAALAEVSSWFMLTTSI
jgi:hypothetical protein